ncbi:hypothetical protein PIB30_037830 [Stylosanthes scabra]|uniref:RRM domain-containing protein n=1 Tax=Stylosanthes scabra TaxID=79078 RepID=A0ABU6SE48_9FABA|nr:hypothetical protein [Stylosanthes scabra]
MRGSAKVSNLAGMSKGVSVREKHCQGTSYAGESDKGEKFWGVVPGAWRGGKGNLGQSWRDIVAGTPRHCTSEAKEALGWQIQRKMRRGEQRISNEEGDDKWNVIERENHSIFVDNLSGHISKRFLYREFGLHGNMVDVFVSRKPRMGKTSVFAFIRYDSKGGATRAIDKLHGSYIAGKEMIVKEAQYRRNGAKGGNGITKKWVRKEPNEQPKQDNLKVEKELKSTVVVEQAKPRREVDVLVSEKQKELLDKSIIAESFEPIKFGLVVEQLDKLKEQYGKIECRDLGPRKCIMSMDLIELRDKALSDEIFLATFDKVREYWGFKWAFSRRVWMEMIGLLIHVWSGDTFEKIAKGLDARMVRLDELTEDRRSFSMARTLVDCFQWEPIQEWITIKCEGTVFDVYVKEFRGEILSRQVHPEDSGCDETVVENSLSLFMASIHGREVKCQEVETLFWGDDDDERVVVVECLIDGCTIRGLGSMKRSMRMRGAADNELMRGNRVSDEREDPKNIEDLSDAVGPIGCEGRKENEEEEGHCKPTGPSNEGISESNGYSCPFPPGFGPCGNGIHVHGELEVGQGSHSEMNANQERQEGYLQVVKRAAEPRNPNSVRVENECEVTEPCVPETIDGRTEAIETRRICEKGGLFLCDNGDKRTCS